MKNINIFISFKNHDEKGKFTRDSIIAEKVYHFLTEKKLKVFFSNISLEILGIAAYHNEIDKALNSATILIAVGTKNEYLESQWVRYEWGSFCKDIMSGRNKDGKIFSVIEDMNLDDLPRALRDYQYFYYSKENLESLYNFIINASSPKKHINYDEAKEKILKKAKSKGFIITKIGMEMRLSLAGTMYLYAFFNVDNYSNAGTLYCHTSGEKSGEVYFIRRGINWFYQEKMKGAENSFIGLPVSDEYIVHEKNPFISRSDFEYGYIEYNDKHDELKIYKKDDNSFTLNSNYKF